MKTLITFHTKRYPACGYKFTLGDPVVYACGDWAGPPKLIHESEAVFDDASQTFIERSCYEYGKKKP